jgi:predicted RNA binding protein YcfA (HicA-like mRNA interferase family)
MNRKLPALKPRRVIRALQRADFFVHHVAGGHYALRHRHNPDLRVTVAYHNQDLKPKTLRSIIRQAGLTIDEFIDLL